MQTSDLSRIDTRDCWSARMPSLLATEKTHHEQTVVETLPP